MELLLTGVGRFLIFEGDGGRLERLGAIRGEGGKGGAKAIFKIVGVGAGPCCPPPPPLSLLLRLCCSLKTAAYGMIINIGGLYSCLFRQVVHESHLAFPA